MRIEYVGHACLLIDTGKLKILTDPWLNGSAYCNQWFLFPKPVIDLSKFPSPDVILYSHGHEDHLHENTLKLFNRNLSIYYPYNWYNGITDFFSHLGFKKSCEAATGKEYPLDEDTTVTYFPNALDSIVVIRYKDTVLVNINDALHAYPNKVIDYFCELIKNKFPKIDYVFCGYGGASYFPNNVKTKSKNDLEVGRLREQLFVHNFCKIVSLLQPETAIPFAADFALLDEKNKWINKLKFTKKEVKDYYAQHFAESVNDIPVCEMYAGDNISNHIISKNSPYHQINWNNNYEKILNQQYELEIHFKKSSVQISDEAFNKIYTDLVSNIETRFLLFKNEFPENFEFGIELEDVSDKNFITVKTINEKPEIELNKNSNFLPVIIKTSTALLKYAMESEWGGDALTVGYGIEIIINDESLLKKGLESKAIQLLTRHPKTSLHIKKHIWRGFKSIIINPANRKWLASKIFQSKKNGSGTIYSDWWINKSKCEICKICDLPLLES